MQTVTMTLRGRDTLALDDVRQAINQARAVLFDQPTRAYIGKDKWDRIKADLPTLAGPHGVNRLHGLDVIIDYDDRERLEFK